MDIVPFVVGIVGVVVVVGIVVVMVVAGVTKPLLDRLAAVAEARLGLARDAAATKGITDEVNHAIDTAAGILRMKMVTGQVIPAQITLGNKVVDGFATGVIEDLSPEARSSGITSADISARLVGVIGHALGDDPTVLSLGTPVLTRTTVDTGTAGAGDNATLAIADSVLTVAQGEGSPGNGLAGRQIL
jgi:hypothetical protein